MSNAKPTDRMKQSFFSLMEGITKALTVDPEDDPTQKPMLPQPTSELFDRATVQHGLSWDINLLLESLPFKVEQFVII